MRKEILDIEADPRKIKELLNETQRISNNSPVKRPTRHRRNRKQLQTSLQKTADNEGNS